jgi:hypothetical protein
MIYVGVYLIKIDGGEVELKDVKVKATYFSCGGILVNGGMTRMNGVSFDEIDLIGKSLITMNDGDVILEECTFNNILLFGGNGSAINANIKNEKQLVIISFFFFFFFLSFFLFSLMYFFDVFFFLLQLLDSIFERCSVRRSSDELVAGGAIYTKVEGGGTFMIIDCRNGNNKNPTFMNCDASEGYGGGIAIYSDSGASGIIFNGERLLFSGCDAIYGKHIFLGTNNFIETYSKTTFDYHYDLSDVNNLVGMIWDSNPQPIVLYKHVCELTKKEYEWIENNRVCVEHADCSDVCVTIKG